MNLSMGYEHSPNLTTLVGRAKQTANMLSHMARAGVTLSPERGLSNDRVYFETEDPEVAKMFDFDDLTEDVYTSKTKLVNLIEGCEDLEEVAERLDELAVRLELLGSTGNVVLCHNEIDNELIAETRDADVAEEHGFDLQREGLKVRNRGSVSVPSSGPFPFTFLVEREAAVYRDDWPPMT